MEISLLSEWNPWWSKNAEILERLKGKERHEYRALVGSIGIREITIITGIRRSGKSTLMYQMIDKLIKSGVEAEQILLANLEDKKLANTSLEEIYECYRENINPGKKSFVFLDEIHRKSGWESWIRKQYDLKTDCKFVISGSCSYLLKKEYSRLLTGRNLTFEVFPLSFREFLEFNDSEVKEDVLKKGIILSQTKSRVVNLLNRYLEIGGFPEVFFKEENYKSMLLKQYFDDILYKDIIERYDIRSQKTKDLALFLITNFTNFISLRNLRNSLGMSYDTIKNNLYYYKEAFLFFTTDWFSYSLKEQKTRPSKVYCIDNGLRNAVSFKFSEDKGRLAENMAFIELKRRGKDVYYWKNAGEVDFVIKNADQTLTAINVTYGDEIDEREIKSLNEFRKTFKAKTKKLLIITKSTEQRRGGIRLVPLWKWLLE